MAIGTNDAIEKFGTQDTVTSSSAAVSDGNFSASSDVTTWTNDDDAVMAAAVFEGTFPVAPDEGSTVDLYGRLMNIQGVNDAVEPGTGATAGNNHVFLGSFPLDNITTEQFVAIDIGLPNTKTSQEYDFYIKNTAGQTLSAGWDLHITPKAIGPGA